MYSLFQLLFRSALWKLIFRRATWQEAGRSVRRAHKDRRARKHLFALLLVALIPFICLLYLMWLLGTGGILLVPFVLPLIWWRARRTKQDDVSLSIAPKTEMQRKELSAEEILRVREHLAKMALFYAVMLDRAGSESYLKRKVLPEGVEVTSRRLHLDLLKRYGVWDLMQPLDRQAMMIADGHWQWAEINYAATKMDILRLLRWLLRLDFYLPVLGQQLDLYFRTAHELVLAPERLFKGQAMADWSEIYTGREAARTFYLRCIAEGISRGWFEAKTEEATTWARELSEQLSGNQHEDLVLGTVLVSEADEHSLSVALGVGELRSEFLAWTMSLLEGTTVPENLPRIFEDTRGELAEVTEAPAPIGAFDHTPLP